jgi:hypothetical protein
MMMIDPTELDNENQKYLVTIKQANNGFIVDVEPDVQQRRPLSPDEAQRKIGTFIKGMEQKMQGGQDHVLDRILDKAKDDEKNGEFQIIGLHIFHKYSEVVAFLSFVYDKGDDKPDTQRVDPKKPKKK